MAILACLVLRKRAPRSVRPETDLRAVKPCHVEPVVYNAMSDHNFQTQRQKTMVVEAKKNSGGMSPLILVNQPS